MTSPDRVVVDLLTGTWRAQALHAAAELGLADGIAAGHRTPADLARWAGADPRSVRRLMRLLVHAGVFTDGTSGYGLTEVSQRLRADEPGSLRALCRLYGGEFHRAWASVTEAVRTGGSGFEVAFGRSLHAHLATEPGAGGRFLDAMAAGSSFFAEVPDAFDFSAARTAVDLAGGAGALLAAVLRRYPQLRGTVVELAHMAPTARAALAEFGDRQDVLVGDVFRDRPPDADVYLLSRVLQDWDDAACARLLARCREAMAPDARLLVVERVVAPDAALALAWDLHLLVVAGGSERTRPEYDALFAAAGLRVERTAALALETTLFVVAPV